MHFVSYSHNSTPSVVEDADWLSSQGQQAWYDRGIHGGSDWQNEIATAIQEADAFICYLSQGFLESNHCLNELSFAVGCEKRVVPIYEEPIELPPGLQLSLGRTQALHKYQLSSAEFRAKLLLALDATEPVAASESSDLSSLAEWSNDFRKRSQDAKQASQQNCSIAIAQFKDLSRNPESSFVAEGMAEDLNMF